MHSPPHPHFQSYSLWHGYRRSIVSYYFLNNFVFDRKATLVNQRNIVDKWDHLTCSLWPIWRNKNAPRLLSCVIPGGQRIFIQVCVCVCVCISGVLKERAVLKTIFIWHQDVICLFTLIASVQWNFQKTSCQEVSQLTESRSRYGIQLSSV